MKIFIRYTLTCFIFLFVFVDLHSATRQEFLSRQDSSRATVYLSTPDSQDSFPMVIYIDGSFKQSVKNNFSVLSLIFNAKNIGVAAIEKRGITENNINDSEWLQHDSFEDRYHDHTLLMTELHELIPKWNGKLIIIGSSEGGKIAPKLTLNFSDHVLGTILIGSGGGLSFGDEIKYQIKQIALSNSNGNYSELSSLDEKIEQKFQEILKHPDSLEQYYGKTYRWYSYYLKYDLLSDLLEIKTPVLMIHGAKDTQIPVESADLIKTSFESSQKSNLDYLKFEDLGHSISKRMDIFLILLDWSQQRLNSSNQYNYSANYHALILNREKCEIKEIEYNQVLSLMHFKNPNATKGWHFNKLSSKPCLKSAP